MTAPLIAGIGYERAALGDVLATLRAAGIATIVDAPPVMGSGLAFTHFLPPSPISLAN